MSSDTATRGTWIVLGGIHLLNGTAPRRADEPIVLVRVAPQEACVPSTTVVVKWDALGACQVSALTADGSPLATGQIEGSALFPDAIAGHGLREMVGEAAAPGLVPLCYLAEHPGGYHVYAQIRFYAEDACFVRTSREPVGEGPVEALRWLDPALAAHAESALRLNNHLRYFRTHFGGTELEYKYNLEPTTDIWTASKELLKALRHGELPGCRPEYREEFQIHYFDNHMFDVTGPDAEKVAGASPPPPPTRHSSHGLCGRWSPNFSKCSGTRAASCFQTSGSTEQGVQVGVGEVQAVAVERVPGRQVPDRGLDRVRLAVQPLHDPLQDASPAASSSCTPDGSSRTCLRTR